MSHKCSLNHKCGHLPDGIRSWSPSASLESSSQNCKLLRDKGLPSQGDIQRIKNSQAAPKYMRWAAGPHHRRGEEIRSKYTLKQEHSHVFFHARKRIQEGSIRTEWVARSNHLVSYGRVSSFLQDETSQFFPVEMKCAFKIAGLAFPHYALKLWQRSFSWSGYAF